MERAKLILFSAIFALFSSVAGAYTPAPGTSGQLIWNSNGYFAAFSMAGDCTFVSPNITCTKTGGVAFAASATINTTTTANITDSLNKRFVTDAQLAVIGNTSGTNTGDVTLGAVGSTPSANAASLSGQLLTLQPADGTHPGVLTSGAQAIGGAKTFSGAISASNLSGTNTGDQTITLTGDVTGSGTGSFATTIGAGKVTYAKMQNEAAVSLLGNPTASSASPSEITLGAGLNFSGTTLVSTGTGGTVTVTGTPSSGNITKFSGGTSITNSDLSGDITTSGALTTTLATVNANTGSFGSSTAIPNFTANGKGLITAAGTNVVIAPAGTLTGATLASGVTASSLTSVGTLTGGTWNATTIDATHGGTAQTSWTLGDILYSSASNTLAKLAGNTTTTKKYLSQTGNGTVSAAPAWMQPACADLSNGATGCSTTVGTAATANTGTSGATLPFLNGANTWSGVQTITNSDWALLGSSTGKTTFTSDNGGASNFTLHVPAANDTIADLAGSQAFTNKDLTGAGNTFPTFNQNTTGSASKWTTARNLAGNSVDGSADVAFANKFIVQGTADAGLSSAQFLGALGTGLVKNTTTTGVLSIGAAGTDYQAPITLTTTGTSGAATLISNTLNIPNYAGGGGGGTVTTTGSPASGNLSAFSGATSITNTNLTGDITTSGTVATTLATVNGNVGSFGTTTSIPSFTVNAKGLITAASGNTVVFPSNTTASASNYFTAYNSATGAFTKAQPAFSDISGQATNAQLATQTANTVLGALTATTPSGLAVPSCSTSASALDWTSGSGFSCNTAIAAATVTTNANLTGPITSSGNATSIASQTGTGTKFVVDTSPSLITPALGVATATSVTAPAFISNNADPADAGILRLGNAENIGWEATPAGTDLTVTMDANNVFTSSVPINATTGFRIGNAAASGKILVGNGTNYVASTPTFPNASATSGKYIKSDGTNWIASTGSASGTGSCTNQFVTTANSDAAPTCSTATLASAQFANQGTTTTVLHGNGAGNPSFAAVSLTADVSGVLPAANGGTGVNNTATMTLGSSNVNLATLGTGLVKNTITTGALTNGASADVIGLFSGCSGSQYLGADGACHTASGAGTVLSVATGNILQGGPITSSGTINLDDPSRCDCRLTLATGIPKYNPVPATPASEASNILTFTNPHGWTTGTVVVPQTTAGGLTHDVAYYINAESPTTIEVFTTLAGAITNTTPITLSAITGLLTPAGIQFKTLYLDPSNLGGAISLYDGSAHWNSYLLTEKSLAISGLTSNTNYDVFVFDSSGTPTLELSAAWTNNTLRADALATQNGVLVKSSAHTRRWLGTVRTIATDTLADVWYGNGTVTPQLYVDNAYNKILRHGFTDPAYTNDNTTTTYTTASTTNVAANAGTGSKIEFLSDQINLVDIGLSMSMSNSGPNTDRAGIGLDSTADTVATVTATLGSTVIIGSLSNSYKNILSEGYHAANLVFNTSAGTLSVNADSRSGGTSYDTPLSYIQVEIWQ